ncbi:MAG TPA: ATP-binding cassette domain-containing protein [Thermopetrobacter sp.]|nr:ATP-binding cassette domain-containing protein [Thermopetrobacter sp.]
MSRIIRFPHQQAAGARPGAEAPPPVKRLRADGRPARNRNTILPLTVQGLTYEVPGKRLIDEVTFTIRPHHRTVILGHNGAGKSLLLRLCHGLLKPTAGRIVWRGPDGADAHRRRLAQAMVFQRPLLLRRSVRDNLMHVLRARRTPAAEARQRIARVLKRVRLDHLAGRPARALSGGEQQKLALARAWLLKPAVLFLDEPTASLDPASTLEVEGIMNALHEASTTIVFATHDLAQARRLADEVLFLHGGRLLENGPAAAFFRRPATAEARAYLSGELLP